MSKINKNYLVLDNTTKGVNAAVLPANRTATNYTPTDTSTKGHLDGVDTKLGTFRSPSSGDLAETSFSLSNNQISAANVTSFAFANANVRSFKAIASVYINATASVYEMYELVAIQRASGWLLQVSSMGDSSQVVFSITSSGQIQYTAANLAGFVSGVIKFRAESLSI